MEEFYYHATFVSNLTSILEKGLIPNYHRYWDYSKQGWLYFSKYENIAQEMAEMVDKKYAPMEIYDSGIVIFAIPEMAFDLSLMQDDNNIGEEYKDEMQCYIYPKNIPPKFLQNYIIVPTV